jgi:hypothetical protein
MKQVACSECQQLASMNETLLVRERPVCSTCAEGVLAQAAERGLTDKDVVRSPDPTVCTQCKGDNGAEDLPRLAGLPICGTCEGKFRNRPYPGWLKLSFVALLGLAIFSFAWNWRFIAGFREIRQMHRAMAAADFGRGADLAESAARHLPEFPEMAGLAYYSRGLDHLSKDQSVQAVDYLRKAKQSAGSGKLPEIDRLLLQAEVGAAFEAKNYDEFLAKSKALAGQAPGDPMLAAGLASAYACKFATTGSEQFRTEALKNLEKASKLAGPKDPEFLEYQPRILHRLETREIITRTEYARRFPNGYQPKAKS